MNLTIVYLTNRIDPKIEWFWRSLHRELSGDYSGVEIIVVDFYADENWNSGRPGDIGPCQTERRSMIAEYAREGFTHIPPKPTFWQGRKRLTSTDRFAASNSRNTGILYARGKWIAFVDDLSVLMPGWLHAIREALNGDVLVMGAYKKVKKLDVDDNGNVISFEEFPPGVDSRWGVGANGKSVSITPSCLFGCSFAAPLEMLLTVNGFDERCDGLGSEDSVLGIMLQNAGFRSVYDRRMLTFESEEMHHYNGGWTDTKDGRVFVAGKSFIREDKGKSPNDKSHAILNLIRGATRSGNTLDFREWRRLAQNGFEIPTCCLDRDWYDGQPLSEL